MVWMPPVKLAAPHTGPIPTSRACSVPRVPRKPCVTTPMALAAPMPLATTRSSFATAPTALAATQISFAAPTVVTATRVSFAATPTTLPTPHAARRSSNRETNLHRIEKRQHNSPLFPIYSPSQARKAAPKPIFVATSFPSTAPDFVPQEFNAYRPPTKARRLAANQPITALQSARRPAPALLLPIIHSDSQISLARSPLSVIRSLLCDGVVYRKIDLS